MSIDWVVLNKRMGLLSKLFKIPNPLIKSLSIDEITILFLTAESSCCLVYTSKGSFDSVYALINNLV